MKKVFISCCLMLFLFLSLSVKGEPAKTKITISSNTVESLLTGLKSDNIGLKTNSAYLIGEFEIKSAVIPLMRVLRDDVSDDVKIAAALALYKLGTPMSIHALKTAARFENSERVKRMCSRFYFEYCFQQELKDL